MGGLDICPPFFSLFWGGVGWGGGGGGRGCLLFSKLFFPDYLSRSVLQLDTIFGVKRTTAAHGFLAKEALWSTVDVLTKAAFSCDCERS